MNIHETLRPITASVLPIATGCDAACPYCFSASSISAQMRHRTLTRKEIVGFLDYARSRGVQRAVVTGGGEPLLSALMDLGWLIHAMAARYPKVVMITNGARLADADEEKAKERWRVIAQQGLTVLAVSRPHWDDQRCAASLGGLFYPFERLADLTRTVPECRRITLRAVCLIQKGLVDDVDDLKTYIEWAESLGIRQITFKELYIADTRGVYYSAEQNLWSKKNLVPIGMVLDFFAQAGAEKIDELPWGCPIFRYRTDRGTVMQIAAYWEPTQTWEQQHGICRSYNLLADGKCYVSLEDRNSAILYPTPLEVP